MEAVPYLIAGSGTSPKDGGCIMQIIDWIDRHGWSDSPPCVHSDLVGWAICANDNLDDAKRQQLLDLAPRLMGTVKAWRYGSSDLRDWIRVRSAQANNEIKHLQNQRKMRFDQDPHLTKLTTFVLDELTHMEKIGEIALQCLLDLLDMIEAEFPREHEKIDYTEVCAVMSPA
jgi:hypothetical protein